jgi:hypothetical protein
MESLRSTYLHQHTSKAPAKPNRMQWGAAHPCAYSPTTAHYSSAVSDNSLCSPIPKQLTECCWLQDPCHLQPISTAPQTHTLCPTHLISCSTSSLSPTWEPSMLSARRVSCRAYVVATSKQRVQGTAVKALKVHGVKSATHTLDHVCVRPFAALGASFRAVQLPLFRTHPTPQHAPTLPHTPRAS